MQAEKYNVKITVTDSDEEVDLTVHFKEIPREAIMAKDYGVPVIAELVKQLEASID
jgi:hypothetical protein